MNLRRFWQENEERLIIIKTNVNSLKELGVGGIKALTVWRKLTSNDFMVMIIFAIDIWLVGFGLAWKFCLESKNVTCYTHKVHVRWTVGETGCFTGHFVQRSNNKNTHMSGTYSSLWRFLFTGAVGLHLDCALESPGSFKILQLGPHIQRLGFIGLRYSLGIWIFKSSPCDSNAQLS